MNSVFKINVNNDETIECIPLSAKVFQNSYDEKLKNLIKIAVFKYLYLEAINSKIYNFPLQLKLCYTLSASDIDYGIIILEISKNDLLLVKKLYVSKKNIYLYKNRNRYFIINVNTMTNVISSIVQVYN